MICQSRCQGKGIFGSKGCLHPGFHKAAQCSTAPHGTSGTAKRCTPHREIIQNTIQEEYVANRSDLLCCAVFSIAFLPEIFTRPELAQALGMGTDPMRTILGELSCTGTESARPDQPTPDQAYLGTLSHGSWLYNEGLFFG